MRREGRGEGGPGGGAAVLRGRRADGGAVRHILAEGDCRAAALQRGGAVDGGRKGSPLLRPGLSQEIWDGIEDMAGSLFLAAFFAGAGDEEADRRCTRLLRIFTAYWQVLRGTYEPPSIFPDLTVGQLLEEFPQLGR